MAYQDPQELTNIYQRMDQMRQEARAQIPEAMLEGAGMLMGRPPITLVKSVVGRLPKIGFRVANIGADGRMYVGKARDIHFHLTLDYGKKIRKSVGLQPGQSTWKAVGFVGPDGKFLTREQALRLTDVRPSIPGELDAMDYLEQIGRRKN